LVVPKEVVETLACLATDAARYITGTTIAIDGGLDGWGQGEPPPEPAG
jgi:NAD(P)-dependent dehydrogenase (short-subunit alcohol dehydrogenase family)